MSPGGEIARAPWRPHLRAKSGRKGDFFAAKAAAADGRAEAAVASNRAAAAHARRPLRQTKNWVSNPMTRSM